ncbi:DUF4367 domain-containing protein [Bacillus litorisediminis]|uniref:DUF4367 domain-containing protein n=1 Tax=Bacillus litorisediminis TaxID=2922713 RepID=UPI001FAEAEA4|nr:DUF4367 domain-containing protein [Bacillus litorisediminis]
MKDPIHDLRKQFKSEADQFLFQTIEFTSDMKEAIRQNTRAEQHSKKRKWNNLFLYLAAAAILCFSLLTLSYFTMTNQAVTYPNPQSEEPQTLNADENNGITNPIAGQGQESQELSSPNEVREVLGDAILLPTYIADGFELEQINAQGENKVIFTYVSADQSYLIMIEKAENQQFFTKFEKVQIHQKTGYLYTTTYDSELHFYANDFHYMISGLINKDEVIKVAEGLQ